MIFYSYSSKIIEIKKVLRKYTAIYLDGINRVVPLSRGATRTFWTRV